MHGKGKYFWADLGHWFDGYYKDNVRDGIGRIPDSMVDPVGEVNPIRTRNQLYGLRVIDTRAGLFAAEELLSGDRYIAMRDAYLQRREFLVNDGQVAAFDEDQF